MGLTYSGGSWSLNAAWPDAPANTGPAWYDASLMLYPAVVFAAGTENADMLDELCEIYIEAFPWLLTIDEIRALGPNNLANAGDGNAKTLPWFDVDHGVWTDNFVLNVQGLQPAYRLLRHIAGIPAVSRTALMSTFVSTWAKVLLTDQCYRRLSVAWTVTWAGEPWSPIRLTRWNELYPFPSPPASPYYYNAMTDVDWLLLQELVESMHAWTLDPSIYAWPAAERADAEAGISIALLMLQDRRTTTPDGEVFFLGEMYDHPLWDYAGVGGASNPYGAPVQLPGVGWDTGHYIRIPEMLSSCYDASEILGLVWPTAEALKAAGDYYATVTFNGQPDAPLFTNYINGDDGWWDVQSAGYGHPPSELGNRQGTGSQLSLCPGNLWGWGQLAPFSEALNTVLGYFILQASTDNEAWRNRYAYYAGQDFFYPDYPVALFALLAVMPEEWS